MITRPQLSKEVDRAFKEAKEIFDSKNADYGQDDDAIANYRAGGVIGINEYQQMLLRILEKVIRVSNLLDKESQTKESIEDSMLDISLISAIFIGTRRIETYNKKGDEQMTRGKRQKHQLEKSKITQAYN